jgi:transposase
VQKSPCGIQRELHAAYLTAVEKVGVAQRKCAETIGMTSAVSKTLLEELKEECSAALSRYAKHRQEHPC